MNDSFELMFLSIFGMFSFGIACFISSCDCSALSKGKQILRYFSIGHFFSLGFFLLLPMIFEIFN